ncbi:MAG: GGDEF domain-containing protein [Spirochaetes bacterium]|nr:GGDEF domain-containing protein [Spirochaetota bacterium]
MFFFRDIFTKFSPVEFYYLIVYYIILFSTFYFKKILQRVRVFDTIRNVAPRLKPLIEARFEIESKVSSLRNENLDLEYHKKNINKIYNQIKLINSTLQLKDMMELSKNILVDVIGLDNFVFYIKDKEEGYSRFLEHNISHEMQQYLQIFLRKKGDKFFDKITSYVKFAIEPEEVLSNLSNINIFPLILKEEILGMLLQYEDKRGKVDETIINNTKIVIRYISMGIKKAMLYNKVQELSQRDGLTLLYLRRTFNGFLEDEFLRAKRYKSKLSLIIFDIDLFKKLNDKYGHLFGDKVLAGIAGIILESIKDPLTASRYGGEEFIVTCPNMNKAQAYELADEIRKKVEKFKFNYNGNSVKTTISGGVAEFSVSMKNGSVLLKNTDDNLYKAKNSGRNKICK